MRRNTKPIGYERTKTLLAGIFLETYAPKKSAVPHIKLDINAKNAAIELT